ncbi:hybrid sensor histidine kinase/response regulator [Euhalothece natronophila]|uniref:hybrid sensor histidine kinase/response regulator n=1 Tax=Euhalothece natronophila TaxID=577489 RepID=UPI001FE35B50|nr:hybrid sensor histidine kinase/response regulator [Euhalothece natronophila]
MPSAQPHNLNRNEYLNEAKKHLETIERGLLNLSGVVRQPETLQSLYEAADFLNTGALFHEMETLQQMAQFFEDCFGVMRTASVVSDKHLEGLLWKIFDTFQGLVDMHLMSEEPTEYTQGVEREVYKGLQPTLNEAKQYLQSRILHEEATVSELTPESEFFHEQVNAELKAMEGLLQQDNPSFYRNELQEHCQVLEQIGAQAKIPTWVKLLKTAQSAIAATENSVTKATQTAIKDIQEAQELINLGEAYKIKPSQRLKAMSLQLSSPWDTQTSEASEEEENNFTIEESNFNNPDLELDEKATIADLDGIFENSNSSENGPEDLDLLDSLDGDLWEGEQLNLEESPQIDHSEDNLQLWDEQETIFEENDELWNEQETALEEDGKEENLEQWKTENTDQEVENDEFLQDLFGSTEQANESDDFDKFLNSISSEEESDSNQDWDDLFSFADASAEEETGELEVEEEGEAASSIESEDNFSWAEQTFEPLEDLETIFAEEEEQTFIQPTTREQQQVDQNGEYETFIEQLPHEVTTRTPQNSLQYYETLDNLANLIEASPQADIAENIDVTALKTYIEQPASLSEETVAPTSEQQQKAEPQQPAQVMPLKSNTGGTSLFEQTVKVPVRLMDHLNNLIGELVVNRNSLEQDQERLRRFLDNLLEQVQNLNDLGMRMQDLYERSLLENSLLASKSYRTQEVTQVGGNQGNSYQDTKNNSEDYDPLEMDRFSGFHLLSQEMIELIVRVRESSSDIEFLVDEIEQEARIFRQVTTQLQEGFTSARMVPFSQVADRLPRAVRDISLKLNKKAQLQVEGKETLVDKMILEQLYDPMTHLVNNAITHGIESPEDRKQAGKSETGTIKVESHHQGNQTIISISDDGAGLDPIRIRRKAVEKGLISQAEANGLPDIDIFDFIFHPGFSTKEKADDFAGRGVGMDVVRSSLSKLRGSINIDSTPGKGTTFIIGLPLTLSITTALCCKLDQSNIAFPVDGVEDKFETSKENIKVNQKGERFIRWQKSSTLLPFKHLSELFVYNRTLTRSNVYAAQSEADEISVVVLRSTGNLVAVQVDQVLGQQEIVIKQLSGPVPKPVGIAGATVTSEGSVMAIADVLELIDLFYGRVRKDVMNSMLAQQEKAAEQEQGEAEPMVLIVDDSITVRELLSMTFSKAGYRVEQARDGKEAWEKLRAGLACDMMFCDIEMPRMDGLELLSRIKQEERFADLPVGMLTSRGADRHRQMATRLGAKGYFTKPYLEEVLLDAAKRMLKGENMINQKANV